jgi:hypothetical protein
MWIRTLGHLGGGERCGGYPVEDYYGPCWPKGLWCTQAKVEGIVLKAAWHCCSDSSVVNGPLGEPGRTTLYVGLPSTWGSVDNDHIFFPSFMGGLLNWEL